MEKTILIVDDDTTFRTRLGRAFEQRGYKTLLAKDFDQAIAACAEAPDLAVLDLNIPGGTGLSLLTKFKQLAPQCKVVLLTGYGTISTAVQAVKEGAVNYLTKPAHADEILNALLGDSHDSSKEIAPVLPTLDQIEWDHIQRVLQDCKGNISKTSKVLGLHRRSLQRKLSKSPNKLQ